MPYRLSIDYGTSNTVAVVRWPDGRCRHVLFDGSPTLPSSVFRQPDGTLLTGRDALHSARLDPASFEPNPKRRIDEGTLLLGGAVVPLVDAVAATLGRVAGEAGRACGAPPPEVVLTYPAAWGAVRRSVLVDATGKAGLPAPMLVAEPVAAAGYFTTVLGHAVRAGNLLVVYDLGAGTFDVSVVRRTGDGFEVCDVDGMADFGGTDLDGLVIGRIAAVVEPRDPGVWRRLTAPDNPQDLRHFRTLWDDARTAKEMLSREPTAGLHLPLVEREVHVTRAEFEAAAAAHLQATAALTATVMRRAGVTAANLAGVFLVGGASRVPLVATTLHRTTGVAPTVLEQPETVVAEGALHALAKAPQDPVPPPAPVAALAPSSPATAWPTVPAAPPATPAPAAPTPPPADSPSASLAAWRYLATALLLVPVVGGLFAPAPAEVLLLFLVAALPGAFLLRHAATWRPPFGVGFAQPRRQSGAAAVLFLPLGCLLLGVSLAATTYETTHSRAGPSFWWGAAGFAAGGAALIGGGLWQLRRYRRPYPRLTVDPVGITYQPAARSRYQLPWTEFARIVVTPARVGQPPVLLAYPKPDSLLPGQPDYAGLARDDNGAFRVDELAQVLNERAGDLPRLIDAIARYQA
jgi:hypothetical protein